MKQMIVMLAMVVLGIFLYNLIAGKGDDSIAGALSDLWRYEIETRTYVP